jgi:hypothetical protein
LVHHACTPAGRREHDRRKDQQRDAVPDAALGDQLAHPHEQHRARGQAHDDEEDAAEGEALDHVLACLLPERAEQEHVADRLGRGQPHREVARVLGDARLPDLALLLELVERRHDDGQELEDDRGGDVGHHRQREQRDPLQPAAAEQVQEAEDRVVGEVLLDRLDRVGVDARDRGCASPAGTAPG